MSIQMQIIIGMVFALSAFTRSLPTPHEDVDIPDVFPAVLPRYDLNVFNEDLTDHPVVTTVISNVENSLKIKDPTDKRVDDEGALNDVDEHILEALMDVETLGKLLEVNTKYIESRKKEDPSWPKTLTAKVASKHASKDEERLLNTDFENAVSSIVVMKMMEERLSFINQYFQESVAAHPDAKFKNLFGEESNESVPVVQGLFQLKYFEGILHSVNTMIEETLTVDDNLPFSSSEAIPEGVAEIVPVPIKPHTSDADDVTFGVGAFIVLILTAIGFFFVIFLVIYLALKLVRKCFENRSSFDKKSKYEQI